MAAAEDVSESSSHSQRAAPADREARRTSLHQATNKSNFSRTTMLTMVTKLSEMSNPLFAKPRDKDFDAFSEDGANGSEDEDDLRRLGSTFTSRQLEEVVGGFRGAFGKLLRNPNFDLLMGLIIITNIGVMVRETDQNAPCVQEEKDKSECESATISGMNIAFLVVYSLEASLRIFVLRCQTFRSAWNILDLVVVFAGVLDLVWTVNGPSTSILRIFRVFRILRAVRIFQEVPELYSMLRGLFGAMQSMLWGFVMIVSFLLLFSVLSVEVIHPISLRVHATDDECLIAFSTVWDCMLMFFQTLVAGDSWGHCALPVIKEQWSTILIFSGALIVVQLGFMNLVLAVIVERAAEAKLEDETSAMKERIKTEQKATYRLRELLQGIDLDESGTISLEELLTGYDTNQPIVNMFSRLDITRNDIGMLFELMDTDSVGALSYDTLMENLNMCLPDNTRKSLTMLRLQNTEILRCLHRQKYLLRSQAQSLNNTSTHIADSSASSSVYASGSDCAPCVSVSPFDAQTQQGEKQLVDMETLDKEVAALRSSLDKALVDMRSSMAKFSDSIALGGQGAATRCFDLGTTPYEEALSGCMQSSGLQPPLDGIVLDTEPHAWQRHPRIAAMLDDKTLMVEQGQEAGDLSL